MVTVVTSKAGAAKRFKCTCGHSEDQKDDGKSPQANPDDPLVMEGFEQTL